MNEFSRVPLGEIAPKRDAEMPSSCELVWNLSLEDIEPKTARIVRRQSCTVSALGSAKCAFDERHVLYSKLRPYLNKVVLPDGRGVGTSELLPLMPDPLRMEREFLAFYLRSPEFVNFAVANSRGANLPRVAMAKLWAHRVPVPTLYEQRRIVRRIDMLIERIDELRMLSTQVAVESNALLPSLLSSTFTELSAIYASGTIGRCIVSSRYGTSRRCDAPPAATPVLRIPNVVQGEVSYKNIKYCELRGKELERLRLETGDILVVRTNGSRDMVGRCAVYRGGEQSLAFASYLVRLRVNASLIDPHYLAFFLSSTMGRDAIARIRRTSAGQYNVNSENLRGIELPLPPLPIQNKVTERLIEQRDAVTKIAGEQTANSDDSDLLTSAVLRKAFAREL